MKRMKFGCTALLALGVAACADDPVRTESTEQDLLAASSGSGGSDRRDSGRSGNRQIAMLDDCDKRDPAWGPIGGCTKRGDVTVEEFREFLNSPLYPTTVVGHPAWANQPSYVKLVEGRRIRVSNEGGRLHTFTKVAEYGGGRAPDPALNKGLVMAPECALLPGMVDRSAVPPGGRLELKDLAEGDHKFQCCLHPWMRALVKVHDERGHRDH